MDKKPKYKEGDWVRYIVRDAYGQRIPHVYQGYINHIQQGSWGVTYVFPTGIYSESRYVGEDDVYTDRKELIAAIKAEMCDYIREYVVGVERTLKNLEEETI